MEKFIEIKYKSCPVCGQSGMISDNQSILCRNCDCRFIWHKEKTSDGREEIDFIADPREQILFDKRTIQNDQEREFYKNNWVSFWNSCYYKYRDKIKCFQYMKNRYGNNCMIVQ